MKRRLTTAFLIALLISAICTFLLSRKIGVHREKPVPQSHYFAAALPLDAGQVLKQQDIKTVAWPASMPLQGGISQAKELVGRAVLYPLGANQPILERDLAAPGMGLIQKIPPGMRAVALRSDEVVGVAGFLYPGSHVDVLVTYRTVRSTEPATATVLQDAEVLATGHQVEPDPTGKPSTVNVVTLLMKPEDAERVVLASTQGSIHFVLRNGADTKQVNAPPVNLSQLIPEAPMPAASRRRAPVVARAKPYVVETVLGTKQIATSFPPNSTASKP